MQWWVLIVIGIVYVVIGSIGAVIVDRKNIGEDCDCVGGTLRERVEFTMLMVFLFWPFFLASELLILPFRELYHLVHLIAKILIPEK